MATRRLRTNKLRLKKTTKNKAGFPGDTANIDDTANLLNVEPPIFTDSSAGNDFPPVITYESKKLSELLLEANIQEQTEIYVDKDDDKDDYDDDDDDDKFDDVMVKMANKLASMGEDILTVVKHKAKKKKKNYRRPLENVFNNITPGIVKNVESLSANLIPNETP